MERFQLIRMSSNAKKNYRCVHSLNISVDDTKCVQNVQKIHPVHSIFICYKKNDLSWLNNLFTARYQLIGISSYVKNKL